MIKGINLEYWEILWRNIYIEISQAPGGQRFYTLSVLDPFIIEDNLISYNNKLHSHESGEHVFCFLMLLLFYSFPLHFFFWSGGVST